MKTKLFLTIILMALCLPALAETFHVTGYCNEGPNGCKICCGKYAKLNRTAANPTPVVGITVAGPRKYKLGTKVFIEGVGNRVIQDRLAARFDARIDVFFATHAEAKKFGIKHLDVTIHK